MTTTIIEDKTIQSMQFFKFVQPMPVVETKKKSYEDACAECGAVTVDVFFDELNARIEKWT